MTKTKLFQKGLSLLRICDLERCRAELMSALGVETLQSLRMYARGERRLDVEVADRLGIAHGTVVRHTQNIYEKVGCRHSTNALVAWFLSQNYDIDLGELRRRLGAMVLMVLFSTFTFGNPDTDLPRRATRRGGRRNEIELILDQHEYF